MTSRVRNADLAQGLGISLSRVSALVRQGMPTDSVEAARTWREARTANAQAPLPAALDTLDDGTLASTIQRHRRLVAVAQGVWDTAMSSGDPNQGKYQTAYNQSLKTLVALEEEQKKRAIDSRDYILRTEAEATVREFAGEVLARLDKLALEVAEKVNPDNPPLAVKVLEAWTRSVRNDLSRDA